MNERSKIMRRLSNRISAIVDQIGHVQNKSHLRLMKEVLTNIIGTEKEIERIISGKYSAIDHSVILSHLYNTSAEVLSSGQNAILFLQDAIQNKDNELFEIRKEFLNIKNKVFKLIVRLDTYYKLHLNSKFHSQWFDCRNC